MEFQLYSKRRRSRKPPLARINERGRIMFNRKAVQHYGLDTIEHVVLGWDPEAAAIGIRPIRQGEQVPEDVTPVRVRHTTLGMAIPARAAWRHWRVPPPNIEIRPRTEGQWIIVPLKAGS